MGSNHEIPSSLSRVVSLRSVGIFWPCRSCGFHLAAVMGSHSMQINQLCPALESNAISLQQRFLWDFHPLPCSGFNDLSWNRAVPSFRCYHSPWACRISMPVPLVLRWRSVALFERLNFSSFCLEFGKAWLSEASSLRIWVMQAVLT